MQPRKIFESVAFISLGATQLFVGPASSFRTLQMNVRSSTRATSPGSDRARKLLGRFDSLSLINVPLATSFSQSERYSASDPSHHWTSFGSHMRAASSTHARSFGLLMFDEANNTGSLIAA